ncbi:MAG: TetR/AcrR family transcriptional regulator, partial [Zoogloea sp.]
METTKPAAKDASSAETRRRILNAAEVLFVAHGFDGTSMRMLTSQAGVNLASVNYHFGSKEELIRAVFRRRLSELNRARLEALAQVEQEADGAPLRPSRIVDAYFGTALRMAADVQGGGHLFMRLLGRTQT